MSLRVKNEDVEHPEYYDGDDFIWSIYVAYTLLTREAEAKWRLKKEATIALNMGKGTRILTIEFNFFNLRL